MPPTTPESMALPGDDLLALCAIVNNPPPKADIGSPGSGHPFSNRKKAESPLRVRPREVIPGLLGVGSETMSKRKKYLQEIPGSPPRAEGDGAFSTKITGAPQYSRCHSPIRLTSRRLSSECDRYGAYSGNAAVDG